MDGEIDVFFKKKIITIYLHPGAREGKRTRVGMVLFTRGTAGVRWGGATGNRRSFYLQSPFLLCPPHDQLKSS